jgi:hypothetical protein
LIQALPLLWAVAGLAGVCLLPGYGGGEGDRVHFDIPETKVVSKAPKAVPKRPASKYVNPNAMSIKERLGGFKD